MDRGEEAAATADISRRYPVGAEVLETGVHFRVWAPDRKKVEVVLASGIEELVSVPLTKDGTGYFSGQVKEARAGTLYWFRLDDEPDLRPDPASRFQPEGPMGPSQVITPSYPWTDDAWRGVTLENQVVYEMHIGTFTPEGTWQAAIKELPELARVGITVLEVMPVADFCGEFGWGYDGVNMYAPTRLYGSPDDFRAFVNAAHHHGLAVILDVVYNHLGPTGNFLPTFSKHYFTDKYETDWGSPINFDGPFCEPVREYYVANAAYWIDEFHLDGLRVDATQNIYDFDDSHEHVLSAATRAARAAAGKRDIIIVAENEPQDVRLIRPSNQNGFGMDGMWNDDLHHTAMVSLVGRKEAYYTDYRGSPQEFVSAAKYAFLYQGQRYKWQKKPRGTSTLGFEPYRFVNFLQNHDQIANYGTGERIHKLSAPGRFRALTAYFLLIPGTPMLFMGQEFGASAPFLYFAHHQPDLADLVHQGRKDFMSQFRSFATPEMQESIPAPHERATFEACKLNFSERQSQSQLYRLHEDLLRLRREEPAFSSQRRHGLDGAVLSATAFVLRFFHEEEDRLLLVNLDVDLHLDPAPEPLLAPPPGFTWEVLWSSEDPRYGGSGTPAIYSKENWRLPGNSAIVMKPVRSATESDEEITDELTVGEREDDVVVKEGKAHD